MCLDDELISFCLLMLLFLCKGFEGTEVLPFFSSRRSSAMIFSLRVFLLTVSIYHIDLSL